MTIHLVLELFSSLLLVLVHRQCVIMLWRCIANRTATTVSSRVVILFWSNEEIKTYSSNNQRTTAHEKSHTFWLDRKSHKQTTKAYKHKNENNQMRPHSQKRCIHLWVYWISCILSQTISSNSFKWVFKIKHRFRCETCHFYGKQKFLKTKQMPVNLRKYLGWVSSDKNHFRQIKMSTWNDYGWNFIYWLCLPINCLELRKNQF